jgi:signal transduction histidine kinase
MPDFVTPFSPEYAIFIPEDPTTLLFLGVWTLLILIGLVLLRDRQASFDRKNLTWLAILSLMVLVLTPFLGVMLFPGLAEHSSNLPVKHFVLFAAVPWMVGAGVLGLLPAGLIAGISGLLLAYLDTHQIATPLLFMTLSLVFRCSLRQGKTKGIARLLRFPLASAVFAWLISTPALFFSLFLSAAGPVGLRFAAAMRSFIPAFLTLGGMILAGGLAATLVRRASPKSWTVDRLGDPAERGSSLGRLIVQFGLLFIIVITLLVSSTWGIAENTVRRRLVQQLTDTARVSSDVLSLFVNIGTSQINDLTTGGDLADQDPSAVGIALTQLVNSQTFFNRLSVFTLEGSPVSSHPPLEEGMPLSTPEELMAISQVAVEGSTMALAAPSLGEDRAAEVSFITGIQNPAGQTVRVLLGRASLVENPISSVLLGSLAVLEGRGGVAQVIDGAGRRIYHTDLELILTEYADQGFTTSTFYTIRTLEDESVMTYYQPIPEQGWAVVTAFPDEVRHLMAWDLAQPLMLAGLIGSLILLLGVFLIFLPQARELEYMKSGIESVVKEQLPSVGMAGRGRKKTYAQVFTQTLASLNRRVQQQRDLLTVYSPNGGLVDLQADLEQVMKAALAQGVSSVRIVLDRRAQNSDLLQKQGPFGLGRDARLYAALDSQIASLVNSTGPLVLNDAQVNELLALPAGSAYPSSLIALPLQSEDEWWGVLWATYPATTDPTQESVMFFRMLSERTVGILAVHALLTKFSATQQQLEQAIDQFPQAMILIDGGGKVLYHNRSFSALIGNAKQELVGRDLFDFLEQNNQPELIKALQSEGETKEIRLENRDVLRIKQEPVEFNGIPTGLIVLFEPLSGLKTQLDSSSELVTIVSHALRSPLTLIHGYTKILRLTGNLNDQQDDYISKIINGIEEMRSLVENLLELGRLESHGVVDFSEFQAHQVLLKIKDSMAAQFRQKNIQLSITQPEEMILIRADFSLLTQAVKNLVDNALKFTKVGGKVILNVREKDGRVVFAVKDTGPGISPLDQRHLFEKLQRGRRGRGEEAAGSGLGLAITRAIVDHHNGRVWVESELGKGSTFFIEIPKLPD